MRTPKSDLRKVSNLMDLLFPVQMVKQTDYECLKDCQYEVFVYPYTKEVEKNLNDMLSLCEAPEVSENQVINPESTEIVTIEENLQVVESKEITFEPDYFRRLRVNVCSDQYKLIPNSDIFPRIEAILNQSGIAYSVSYSMLNFSRFYVEYTIEDQRFAYDMGNGDYIKPVIKVSHSYNGATNYKIVVGWFRLVCSNGLVIAIEDMKKYNLIISGKHTEKIESSLHKFEELLTIFNENNPVLAIVLNKFTLLNSMPINDLKNTIEKTLEKTGIISVDNKNLNTVNYVQNKINSELKILGLNVPTLWHIYNAINFYINDSTLNKTTPDLKEAKDQKVFEYLLKIAFEHNKANQPKVLELPE